MVRVPGLLVIVAVLLATAGQSATTAHADLLASQVGVGTPVSYVGPEGDELGQLTIEDVVTPFRDYDPGAPPDRGSRYVLVQLNIENSGTRPLIIDPAAFLVQDTDGFLIVPETTSGASGSAGPAAALVPSELEPGASITGSLVFQIVNAAEPARVVFQPGRDRLLILADLTATARPVRQPAETEDATRPVNTPTPPVAPPPATTAETQTHAILLVTYNCPPGTTLEELQVTACPRVATGFEPVLTGAAGIWTVADLVAEQAGPVWHGVPDGQYVLTFTTLPGGHDLYYVYGEGAAPTVDYIDGEGVAVTLGPDTVTPAGSMALNIYFVTSDA